MRAWVWLALSLATASASTAQAQKLEPPSPFRAVCAPPEVTGAYSWSPDSTRLAFSVKGPGPDNLRILDVSTMKVRRLSIGDVYGVPIWSPNDERIAIVMQTFDPKSNQSHRDIHVVSGKGGKPIRQIASGLSYYTHPMWSPDGSAILATTPNGEAVLIDVATGASQRLLTGLYTDDDSRHNQPNWIDAQNIAFERDGKIYRFNLTTHEQATMPLPSRAIGSLRATAPGEYWYIDWRSEGATLTVARGGATKEVAQIGALNFDGPTSSGQILTWPVGGSTQLIDASTGKVRQLWPEPPRDVQYRNEYGAVWSPDGSKFAFGRIEGGSRRKQSEQVCIGIAN